MTRGKLLDNNPTFLFLHYTSNKKVVSQHQQLYCLK